MKAADRDSTHQSLDAGGDGTDRLMETSVETPWTTRIGRGGRKAGRETV